MRHLSSCKMGLQIVFLPLSSTTYYYPCYIKGTGTNSLPRISDFSSLSHMLFLLPVTLFFVPLELPHFLCDPNTQHFTLHSPLPCVSIILDTHLTWWKYHQLLHSLSAEKSACTQCSCYIHFHPFYVVLVHSKCSWNGYSTVALMNTFVITLRT